MAAAGRSGDDTKVLKYLLGQSKSIQLTEPAWEGSACTGTVYAVELLLRRYSHLFVTEAILLAAASNSDEMLVVLLRNGTL